MALTILVTGATAGFGTAVAHRFVHDGHRVIAAARRTKRLQALRAELGTSLLPLALDVTDAVAVAALPSSLPADWQDVDVLINNAGLARGLDPAHKASLADWDRMVAMNVSGMMHMTHALLPGMVERNRGHMISISSIAAIYPYPGGHVYGLQRPSSPSSASTCVLISWACRYGSQTLNLALSEAPNSASTGSAATQPVPVRCMRGRCR